MLWKTPKVQQRELEQRRVKAELLLAASALLGVHQCPKPDRDLTKHVCMLSI